MRRKLTSRSSLATMQREAKRWLKALRAGEAEARKRLEQVLDPAPAIPTLRDIQHALAREHGLAGWTALRDALAALPSGDGASAAIDPLESMLRAASTGDTARITAILDQHPAIVSDRGELHGHIGRRTALHFAVGGRHEAAVALLLVYEQSLVTAADLSQLKRAFDLNGYVGILYMIVTALAVYTGR